MSKYQFSATVTDRQLLVVCVSLACTWLIGAIMGAADAETGPSVTYTAQVELANETPQSMCASLGFEDGYAYTMGASPSLGEDHLFTLNCRTQNKTWVRYQYPTAFTGGSR